MIRFVLVAAAMALLFMVTYLPARTPAAVFSGLLVTEHAAYIRVLGDSSAHRILTRIDRLHQSDLRLSAPPRFDSSAPHASAGAEAASTVAGQRLNIAVERFFAHAYFRSIDAQFALAAYRASACVELLPLLLIFVVVALLDGLVIRAVRSKSMRSQRAEMFGITLVLSIAVTASLAVALFAPVQLAPLVPVTMALLVIFLLGRTVAHYHVIG